MKKRILVVDDSSLNIKVADTVLKKLSIDSVSCPDAHSCYTALSDGYFDMILMDYLMPGVNGIDASKAIRQMHNDSHDDSYYKNIPIIVLTAEDSTIALEGFKKCGVNDIIHKPITASEVTRMIEKWCPEKSKEPEIRGIPKEILDRMLSADKEQFIELIRLFIEDIPDKHVRIETALKNNDYESYTVEVHRIKGEARMISAYKLSENAKALELTGKALTGIVPNDKSDDENLSYILNRTPILMNELDVLCDDTVSFLRSEDVSETDINNPNDDTYTLSAENIEKLERYVSHAKESLIEKDYTLVNEWLDEISNILKSINLKQ